METKTFSKVEFYKFHTKYQMENYIEIMFRICYTKLNSIPSPKVAGICLIINSMFYSEFTDLYFAIFGKNPSIVQEDFINLKYLCKSIIIDNKPKPTLYQRIFKPKYYDCGFYWHHNNIKSRLKFLKKLIIDHSLYWK